MTGKKSTKYALWSSVMAMVLSVAMLMGTTFAWFTDTASTAVNKIQAGTLDVALEMKDAGGNWVSAEGKTLEFIKAPGHENEPVLWEPGCTYELPQLRVVNNGNLALKYKLIITGINGDAQLNEAIEWTIDGLAVDTEYSLAAGADSASLTISGHMKETAGNEYQGLSIDGIAITVYATQDTVENDSFDNTYDIASSWLGSNDSQGLAANTDVNAKTVKIESAEQLASFAAAVNAGETYKDYTITLEKDIDLNNFEWTSIGNSSQAFSGIFDGNNKKISNLKISSGSIIGLFGQASGAEIKNVNLIGANVSGGGTVGGLLGWISGDVSVSNCTIDATSVIKGTGSNTGGLIGTAQCADQSTVSLENLVNYASVTNTATSYSRAAGIIGQVTTNTNATIKNCRNEGVITTNNGYAGGIISAYQNGSLTIDSCTNNTNLDSFSGNVKVNLLAWFTDVKMLTVQNSGVVSGDMIGIISGSYVRNITIDGDSYFLNKTSAPFTFESALENKKELPTDKMDRIIDFYKFAKTKNPNFATYPETYWGLFNGNNVGFSNDWTGLLNDYNNTYTDKNLTTGEFTSNPWREVTLYVYEQ